MQTQGRLTTGDSTGYGFGLVTGRYRGVRFVEHNGADAGYRSYAGRFPDQGLSVVVLCNAATANTTALARGVANAYLGGALTRNEPEVAPQATPVSPGALERRKGVYFQPRTMQVVEATVRDGRLVLGNIPLIPLSENRFRLQGQNTDLLFADGERPGFSILPAGAKPVVDERRDPVKLSGSALAAYAGDYQSDELARARYTVTATDSTLLLKTGTSQPMTARALFADTFIAGGYTIQFSRKGSQVVGFDVTNGRMRHVLFVRQ
jgi:hypothetical protein